MNSTCNIPKYRYRERLRRKKISGLRYSSFFLFLIMSLLCFQSILRSRILLHVHGLPLNSLRFDKFKTRRSFLPTFFQGFYSVHSSSYRGCGGFHSFQKSKTYKCNIYRSSTNVREAYDEKQDKVSLSNAKKYEGWSQSDFMEKDQCLVVDRNDFLIDTASKKDCHIFKFATSELWKVKLKEEKVLIQNGYLHRAFSVFLFNSEGKLLLQQRAGDKLTFPNVWTNTCCSHPLSGYSPCEIDEPEAVMKGSVKGIKYAAIRKLNHELGISPKDIDIKDFKFLTRVEYMAPDQDIGRGQWGENEIDYILFLQWTKKGDENIPLSLNSEEVQNIKYVDQEELKLMMDDTSLLWSPWFRLIAERFLLSKDGWWSNLHETLSTENFFDPITIHRFVDERKYPLCYGDSLQQCESKLIKGPSHKQNENSDMAQFEMYDFKIQQEYQDQIIELLGGSLKHDTNHPIYNFIFEYYHFKPKSLLEYSPGFGKKLIVKDGDLPLSNVTISSKIKKYSSRYNDKGKYHEFLFGGNDEFLYSTTQAQQESILNIKELLRNTIERPPHFTCFGLHEWAMVYQPGTEVETERGEYTVNARLEETESQNYKVLDQRKRPMKKTRHQSLPFRLPQDEINRIVESKPIICTHFDAFRFFNPSARKFNLLGNQLSRDNQPKFDQPGCLHANMDLFKWAIKLQPFVPSRLLLACLQIAIKARILDMRASPYDLRSFNFSSDVEQKTNNNINIHRTGLNGETENKKKKYFQTLLDFSTVPVKIETVTGKQEYQKLQQEIYLEAKPIREELYKIYEEYIDTYIKKERKAPTFS